jgi:hypothetical protein
VAQFTVFFAFAGGRAEKAQGTPAMLPKIPGGIVFRLGGRRSAVPDGVAGADPGGAPEGAGHHAHGQDEGADEDEPEDREAVRRRE